MRPVSHLLLTWIILTVCMTALEAQTTVEETYPLTSQTYVKLEMRFPDSVIVTPSKDDQLRIVAQVKINEGENDDAFYFASETQGNTLSISTKYKNEKELFQQQSKYQHGGCSCCNHNFLEISVVVYIPVNQSFSLAALGSDLIIGPLTGDIQVLATGGFIDMEVAEQDAGTVHLKSIGASVYSDLTFPTKSNLRFLAGTEIQHSFPGSDRKLTLESIGNDVYIRKP